MKKISLFEALEHEVNRNDLDTRSNKSGTDLDELRNNSGWLVPKKIFFLGLVLTITIASGLGIFLGRSDFWVESKKESKNIFSEKKQGIDDKKTFRDQAEGILREGGIDGEGNFHLERPGGPSQNVYLTSSTVDLSQFIGKKVRVWGETFAGQKAGWLMDVGLVEIIK